MKNKLLALTNGPGQQPAAGGNPSLYRTGQTLQGRKQYLATATDNEALIENDCCLFWAANNSDERTNGSRWNSLMHINIFYLVAFHIQCQSLIPSLISARNI